VYFGDGIGHRLTISIEQGRGAEFISPLRALGQNISNFAAPTLAVGKNGTVVKLVPPLFNAKTPRCGVQRFP